MSDPPPSPLETTDDSPENDQKSKRPYVPSLGSHALRAISYGERANDPGGSGRPRSRTQTDHPDSARRLAITDPPNPLPTTTASKCSVPVLASPCTVETILPNDGIGNVPNLLGRQTRAPLFSRCPAKPAEPVDAATEYPGRSAARRSRLVTEPRGRRFALPPPTSRSRRRSRAIRQGPTLTNWPEGTRPDQSSVFCHNEMMVPTPPQRVWEWLVTAGMWSRWYVNAGNVKLPGNQVRL